MSHSWVRRSACLLPLRQTCQVTVYRLHVLTGPCLVNDRRAASVTLDVSDGVKMTIRNLTARDMWWPRERWMQYATSVAW
jgi:hypothetical protein